MRDYTHKTVYIGIDVHKRTYAVSAICDKAVVKRDTLTAIPELLISYINTYFKGAKVKTAYEAGFSGFYLHRCLLKAGIDNIIVHAASIKIAANDRVKTDKRDSLKIAKQLSAGDLVCINIPSENRELRRELTRMRDQFVDDRKRIICRIKSLLFRYGLIEPHDETKASKVWLQKIQRLATTKALKDVLDVLIKAWLEADEKIKEVLIKLQEQAKEDKAIDVVYRSVPGIGALSARILSNELEDMKHFHNEKALFNYTGLTPSEYSSGEHKRLGSISRQGKASIRKILVQVAWRSIKIDKHLLEVFERISKQAGKKKAIVAVARKIAGCIRACFVNGEMWSTTRLKQMSP